MEISSQISSILDGTERKEGYKLQGLIYKQKREMKKENGKRKAEEKRKREWAKYGAKTVEEYLKAKQQLCGAKMQEDTEEQTKKQEGNPQLEDGFVKIANELVDVFCSHRLSGEEWQIIWSVFNKTYRWHRKDDWISLSQFVEMTGMQKSNISRALKKLLNKKIIIKSDNKYMFNKYYKEWVDTSKKKAFINTDKAFINTDKDIINTDKDNFKTQSQSIKTDEIINTDNIINTDKEIIKIDKTFIKNDAHKIYYTKDNYTKDIKKKESIKKENLEQFKQIPSWLDTNLWNEFRKHRRAIKHPLTPYAEKLLIAKLDKWRSQYDIKEIIETSIENGWQGLFEPKRRANKLPTKEDFERQARNDPESYYAQWGIQLWEVKRAVWKSVKKYTDEQKEKILKKTERRLGKEWWKN